MISDETLRRVLPEPAVNLLGDLIRWLAWALVFIVWAAFLQIYGRMIRLTLADQSNSDFTIFYYTARLIADGLPMYGVSPERYGVKWAADHLGNLNPPHFQLLALPLGHMSYGSALAAWVGTNLACLIYALVLIARELEIRFSWPRFWLWGAFTLSSAAFTTVAVTCELTFALMLPFTIGWRAWRRGRWAEAGAWLGACASVKLFLLLIVPWLAWRRQWRALVAFGLTFAALVGLGALVFGFEPYRQWAATLGRVGWWWITMNASWQGFVSRILSGSAVVTPLVHRADAVAAATAIGAAVIAAATLVAAVRSKPDADGTLLLLVAGAVLASPLGWVYYLPLCYGPLLDWMGASRQWEGVRGLSRGATTGLFAGLALLYVPHETTLVGQPSGWSSLTIGSAYFWGVLTLWGTLLKARAS